MNVFTSITSATRAALLYITVGSVMIVWSTIYYFYLQNHAPEGTDTPWYWDTGFLLTGATLLVIGLAVGWIGRSARQAEQPHAVISTPNSKGNPMPSVVPLANNAIIPTSNNLPPGAVPVNPAVQQPALAPPVPPQNIMRS